MNKKSNPRELKLKKRISELEVHINKQYEDNKILQETIIDLQEKNSNQSLNISLLKREVEEIKYKTAQDNHNIALELQDAMKMLRNKQLINARQEKLINFLIDSKL